MAGKKSCDLTDYETEQMIELYQRQPNLWDTSLQMYHDRNKRSESLNDILDSLGNPELSEQDLKSKIQCLRCSFTRELRKERNSRKSGAGKVFVSKWKYFKHLEFLRPHIIIKEVYSSMTDNGNQQHMNLLGDSQDLLSQGSAADLTRLFQQVQPTGAQLYNGEVDADPDSEPSSPSSSEMPSPSTPLPSTTAAKRKRSRPQVSSAPLFDRKHKRRREEEREEDVALSILKALVRKEAEADKDENEHFARYIISQLSKLPGKRQREARRKISEVLDDILDECESCS